MVTLLTCNNFKIETIPYLKLTNKPLTNQKLLINKEFPGILILMVISQDTHTILVLVIILQVLRKRTLFAIVERK